MSDATFGGRSVAIVGGGFAGAALAIRLLDGAQGPLRLTVVERRAALGRGVAYDAPDPAHLLNGPSELFSLYDDDPGHFTRWTVARAPATGWTPPADAGAAFAPRRVYGDYVAGELDRAVAAARGRAAFRHVRAEATGLRLEAGGAVVATEAGPVRGDVVVLATGVHAPAPLFPDLARDPRLLRGPDDAAGLDRLAAVGGDVLIVGQSLSMVDAVASLEARGFRGRYLAISRNGHLIEPRRDRDAPPAVIDPSAPPRTARALLAATIAARRALLARGGDWQLLPAAIRPHLPALWAAAPTEERLRFVRHLRSLWDVSLHLAAPESFAAVAEARAAGRFVSRAARLVALEAEPTGLVATLRPRGAARTETLRVAGLVDCRGRQEHDWRRMDAPLPRRLLASGLARPHATGFGLDATPDGRLVGADGSPEARLRAIGHPLRGVAWESSSIPEQRAQATALGARLLADLGLGAAQAAE